MSCSPTRKGWDSRGRIPVLGGKTRTGDTDRGLPCCTTGDGYACARADAVAGAAVAIACRAGL